MNARIAVVGTIVVFAGLSSAVDYLVTSQGDEEFASIMSQRQSETVASNVRMHVVDLMRTGADEERLQSTIEDLKAGNPSLLELRLLPARGETETAPPADDPAKVPGVSANRGLQTHRIPILADASCTPCHQVTEGTKLGTLSVTVDVSPIFEAAEKTNARVLASHIVEVVVLILLVPFMLSLLVFRPMRRLGRHAKQIAAGDFSEHKRGESDSEIGEVIRAFNMMSVRIRDHVELQDQAIREKTTDLQFMLDSARAVGATLVLSEVLTQSAESLTRLARVTFCRIILRAQAQLEVKAAFPIRALTGLEAQSKTDSYPEEACPQIGAVFASCEERLFMREEAVTDAERDLLLLDKANSVLCVPIWYHGRALGIAALGEFRSWTREPFDGEKIGLCRAMAVQAGSAIENASLHEELVAHAREAVVAMAAAVDAKSRWTAGHSERVGQTTPLDCPLSAAPSFGALSANLPVSPTHQRQGPRFTFECAAVLASCAQASTDADSGPTSGHTRRRTIPILGRNADRERLRRGSRAGTLAMSTQCRPRGLGFFWGRGRRWRWRSESIGAARYLGFATY